MLTVRNGVFTDETEPNETEPSPFDEDVQTTTTRHNIFTTSASTITTHSMAFVTDPTFVSSKMMESTTGQLLPEFTSTPNTDCRKDRSDVYVQSYNFYF